MFVGGFIVDLLVQHEFRGVKLISRKVGEYENRTEEHPHSSPHY